MAAPTVTTNSISAITSNSALANCTLSATGGKTVTARGIQFSTTPNSGDRSVDETSAGFSTGVFTESLTNLFGATTYYFRAYATNADGTGFGSWLSFATLADGYKITINGVDRTADILIDSLTIEDIINDKQTNCSFDLVDRRSLGLPSTDQEVIITLNSGVKIFGGYTITINQKEVKGTMVIAQITCVDYTRIMDRNLVNETYSGGQYDSAIIANIIANYCQGFGITGTNVIQGVAIDMIVFNYIQFSKAMRTICDLTGRNWYIDYNKDIHYFPITQNPAPFNITDSPSYTSGTGYFGLNIIQDASQIKNRVYVRGGTKLSDATTYQTKGDGSVKKFVLPDKPHSVSVAVNGVNKTLGIKNIDTTGFDFYLNYDEKYIEQDSTATVLTTTDVLTVNYTYDIPILVAVENSTSINSNGAHEFIIVDKTIATTQAARDRASAELTDYANNIVEGSFFTYTDGFRSGQYVNVNSTVLGVINTNYIVQKVIAKSIGGGKFVYQVYLASSKTMGIIRFLLEMLESNKNLAQVATNEVLDNLITLNDSLDPNSLIDALTIDSWGAYQTWAKDSLEVTKTRLQWDLSEWM